VFFGKKPVTVQIEANVQWEVIRDAESGMWIGVCHALNLNAAGETWAELQACIAESIGLLLEDLFADGELDMFLRAQGWSPLGALPPRGDRVRFDVPFSLERRPAREFLAALA
jgi:predicted RNase H-like HicB family nuclease